MISFFLESSIAFKYLVCILGVWWLLNSSYVAVRMECLKVRFYVSFTLKAFSSEQTKSVQNCHRFDNCENKWQSSHLSTSSSLSSSSPPLLLLSPSMLSSCPKELIIWWWWRWWKNVNWRSNASILGNIHATTIFNFNLHANQFLGRNVEICTVNKKKRRNKKWKEKSASFWSWASMLYNHTEKMLESIAICCSEMWTISNLASR